MTGDVGKLDGGGSEVQGEEVEDFGAMLAASLHGLAGGELVPGEVVSGPLVGFDDEWLFVDLHGKSEALMARAELTGDDGQLTVEIGDRIEGYVIEAGEGAVRLSHSLARKAQSRDQLVSAFQSGMPVEGKVAEAVKGGFRVSLGEGMRGFCPISQIDIAYCEDPQEHVGQTYRFALTEVREGPRGDIVLSRRRLLAAEREALAAELKERLEPGLELQGTVRAFKPFGAFIEVGGMEGLLHVSQISRSRVRHPEDYMEVGQELLVVVKSYDPESGRLSLTRIPLEPDPWDRLDEEFPVGGIYPGTVVRVMDFGAFVELTPGLEGLLHASEIAPGRRGTAPHKLLSEGDTFSVRIQSVDPERRRISLARVFGEAPEKLPPLEAGSVFHGIVDGHADFGVFVTLPGGLGRGLMPKAETGFSRGADLRKEMPEGSEIEVQVLGIEERDGRHRIRLSHKAVEEGRERALYQDYQKGQSPKEEEQPLGALGLLLAKKGFRLGGS